MLQLDSRQAAAQANLETGELRFASQLAGLPIDERDDYITKPPTLHSSKD